MISTSVPEDLPRRGVCWIWANFPKAPALLTYLTGYSSAPSSEWFWLRKVSARSGCLGGPFTPRKKRAYSQHDRQIDSGTWNSQGRVISPHALTITTEVKGYMFQGLWCLVHPSQSSLHITVVIHWEFLYMLVTTYNRCLATNIAKRCTQNLWLMLGWQRWQMAQTARWGWCPGHSCRLLWSFRSSEGPAVDWSYVA